MNNIKSKHDLQFISLENTIDLVSKYVESKYDEELYIGNENIKPKAKQNLFSIEPRIIYLNRIKNLKHIIKLGYIEFEKGTIVDDTNITNYESIKLVINKKLKGNGEIIHPANIEIIVQKDEKTQQAKKIIRTDKEKNFNMYWKKTNDKGDFPTIKFLQEGIYEQVESINGNYKIGIQNNFL
jgi:hypothetical protein